MEPAICIEMFYEGLSPEEKVIKTTRHGFHNIEFWGYADKDIGVLGALKQEPWRAHYVNFSGQRSGDLIDASTHQTLLDDVARTILVARRLGTSTLMALSNELGQGGRVVHPHPEISNAEKRENTVASHVKAGQYKTSLSDGFCLQNRIKIETRISNDGI